MPPHPMIKVEHLSKKYRIGVDRTYMTLQDSITGAVKSTLKLLRRNNNNNTFWALKDVSFEVEEGEVVGIIGRNGAGKSTLLKILSRITEPTEGRITMHGRVASLLEVGTGFRATLAACTNAQSCASGGRTHVCCSIRGLAHLEPEILVVDEVLAVGDAAFQKKCLGKMCN